MNYLQLKDDSTLAIEEACLADYFGNGNYVTFYAKDILQHRIMLQKGDFVAGSIQVTIPALRQLGVETYRNDDYPSELGKYLYRNIWTSTMKNVRQMIEIQGELTPVFIKPLNKVKRFSGRVVSTRDDLASLCNIGGNVELCVSNVVRWISEYRVPVIHGKIQGYFNYDGDIGTMVDKKTVEDMVKDYESSPAAYCLDVGVLDTGKTALIERNDAFSIGLYNGMETCYGELLTTRWVELTR